MTSALYTAVWIKVLRTRKACATMSKVIMGKDGFTVA